MLKIKLNKKDYNYICQASFIKNERKNLFFYTKQHNNKLLIVVSEDQAGMIRDLCGEQLQIVGFNEKYELTPEGEILESLIDKFFIG